MSEDDKDERFYRDTEAIAFPKLDDWQLALLEPLGHRRMLRRGELVFKAGQRDLGLTVVLSGEVEAFEARDGIRANPGYVRAARFCRRRGDAQRHLCRGERQG
jgi:thioredoxin reductase (NADPH)